MNILYLSCHSVLEYDECKLLSEAGYTVRAIGSYTNPNSPGDPKRPPLPHMDFSHQHIELSNRFHQDTLHEEHLAWADVIIFMHMPDWVQAQLEKLKAWGKPVIYRCIGQNHPLVENMLNDFRVYLGDQFHVIRYDKREKLWQGANQDDIVIPFTKDIDYSWAYHPENLEVLMVMQAAKQRGFFCHYNELLPIARNFSSILVGNTNEDCIEEIPTACPDYPDLLKYFANSNIFLYSGTIPASYTLGVLEAMAVGTPIITIDDIWWRKESMQWIPSGMFAVPEWFPEQIIRSEADGIDTIRALLDFPDALRGISARQREYFELRFSQEAVTPLWTEFLGKL